MVEYYKKDNLSEAGLEVAGLFKVLSEPELGALLPRNVIIYEQEGRTHDAAVELEQLFSVFGNEVLKPIAEQISNNLGNIVEELDKG